MTRDTQSLRKYEKWGRVMREAKIKAD